MSDPREGEKGFERNAKKFPDCRDYCCPLANCIVENRETDLCVKQFVAVSAASCRRILITVAGF
jgi:hypothetical protein